MLTPPIVEGESHGGQCVAQKGKASFSVNGTLPYLTSWVVSFFVLNFELGLHCEVHILVSKTEGKELGYLAVLPLSG